MKALAVATSALPYAIDKTRVEAFAAFSVQTLRANGYSDARILAEFTRPHATADARFEASQIDRHGAVVAPAVYVKAAMHRIVAEGQSTAAQAR